VNSVRRILVASCVCVAWLLAAAPRPVCAASPEASKEASAPVIQVTGRVIHGWYDEPDHPNRRILLVIDGFTVLTRQEQLTARDGVVWYDAAAAEATGTVRLGVYAETGVSYRDAAGKREQYDSVYLVLESEGKVTVHSDQPIRGKAEDTELFLRAKKLRREYLAEGRRERPTAVTEPPRPQPGVEPPGVREAGVPQEITIVAQDDVRQVNFTSFVEDGTRVSVWTGGVYVMRGDMEMAADSIVIWTPEEALRRAAGGEPGADRKTAPEQKEPEKPAPAGTPAEPPLPKPAGAPSAEGGRSLAAEAYLEGHVRVVQGRRTLTCSRLYYDFRRNQALAIDTKIRTFSTARNVPVYYYAKEVRQLGRGIFRGTDAWMTTCEFAHPHYQTGGSTMTLTDLTPEPKEGEPPPQYHRVRFAGEDVQVRIRGLPVTYWPRLAGDVRETETALRTVRIESRSNRGTGVRSQWHLMKLLGLERPPEGFDLYLDADAWSERGPALGVQGDYVRKDFYGDIMSYVLRDSGKDSVGGDDVQPSSKNRGRFRWRHRHYLPQNWELTLELSKITDRNFLNEFYEEEDETEKTQETLLYLKKQEREQAFTFLTTYRLNDWQTLTDYYPQLGYNIIGHSLWDDHLTYFQDSELSIARFRPDEDSQVRGSNSTVVADTIHELDIPLKLGPVNLVPFGEVRLSYFEETLNRSGSEDRFAARFGGRAAAHAWRVYENVESDFWDLHGLRHVNVFDVGAYAATNNVRSIELIPFDVAEMGTPVVQGVDEVGVVDLGWRQRFQTKRGPEGRRRSVDWLILDLEAVFYNNRHTPELAPDGRKANNRIDFAADWRVTDSASVWSDTNFNLNDGTLDVFTVGTTITHTPRLSYTVGHRYVPDGDSAQTLFGFDYRINRKWRVLVREYYDFDRGENAQTDFVLARRLHRWMMRVRLEVDPGEDESFIGLEFQPLGAPEIGIGGG